MAEFILYSYYRSSASFRVRIAMNLKGLPYEYRAIHLLKNGGEQNSASFKELNPLNQVPALVHSGKTFAQSVAIIEYLEEIKPTPALFPKDPAARAQVRQISEIINSGSQPLVNLIVLQELEKTAGFNQEQKDKWAALFCEKGLAAVETILETTAGKYAVGDTVTAADCFVVPHTFTSKRFHVDIAKYPNINRITKACLELPAFQKAAPDAQPDYPGPEQK